MPAPLVALAPIAIKGITAAGAWIAANPGTAATIASTAVRVLKRPGRDHAKGQPKLRNQARPRRVKAGQRQLAAVGAEQPNVGVDVGQLTPAPAARAVDARTRELGVGPSGHAGAPRPAGRAGSRPGRS